MGSVINCPKCNLPIQLGNISEGLKITCGQCGVAFVLKSQQGTGNAGTKSIPARRFPPTSGNPSTRKVEKMTPLMRKASRAKLTSRRTMAEDNDRESRHQQAPKSRMPLFIGIGIAAAVLLIVIIVIATSAGKKPSDKNLAAKGAAKQADKTPVASIPPTAKSGTPTPPAPKSSSGDSKAPSPSTPPPPSNGSDTSTPAPGKFAPHTADDVTQIGKIAIPDESVAGELDAKLKESFSKKGDPQIRGDIAANANKYWPALVDRLASNDEALFTEAAHALNTICGQHRIGSTEGGGAIDLSNMKKYNDPNKRLAVYRSLFDVATDKVKDEYKTWGVAGPVGDPNTPSVSVENVDRLVSRVLSGEEFDAAVAQLKAKGSAVYPDLVKAIDVNDLGKARNAVRLLNEIAPTKTDIPKESTIQQIKQQWEDWLKQNK